VEESGSRVSAASHVQSHQAQGNVLGPDNDDICGTLYTPTHERLMEII